MNLGNVNRLADLPVQNLQTSFISRWISAKITPRLTLARDITVETCKKEYVAITLLALTILGIFPVWVSLTLGILAMARLSWTVYHATSHFRALEEKIHNLQQKIGRLELQNDQFIFQRDNAARSRDEARQEGNALRAERDLLRVDLRNEGRVQGELAEELDVANREIAALNAKDDGDLRQLENGNRELNLLFEERQDLDGQLRDAEANRDAAFEERDAAIEEHERLRIAVEQAQGDVQMNELVTRWTQIAAERNNILNRIAAAYDEMKNERNEEHQAALDREIESFNELQGNKEEALELVDRALQKLPPLHSARFPIQKLQTALKMESHGSKRMTLTFGLHSALKEMGNPAELIAEGN